jgi:hypothetical protein
VPAAFEQPEAEALVIVSDASGQEVFHSLKLRVK